ncbi:uncharacterized protein [Apostichopus japonicus]
MDIEQEGRWICFSCAASNILLPNPSLTDLLHHVRSPHGLYPNFNLVCGFEHCLRNYKTFKGIWKHMTEVHPHFFLSGPAPNSPYLYPAAPGILENALAYLRLVQEDHGYMQDIARPLVREPDEENFMEEDEEVGQENHAYMQNVAGPLVRQPDEGDAQNVEGTLMAHEGDQQADPILVVENNNQCNHLDKYTTASMFLARVQHRSCLPQATVDNIKDETCALVQNILQRLHIKVNSALEGYCSPALMNTVSEYFQDEINPFDDLDTAYRQKKFFETLFPLVKAREGFLGNRLLFRGAGDRRRRVMVQDYFYYVPVLEQLKVLLSNQRYLKEVVKRQHHQKNAIMTDVSNGTILKTHELFSRAGTSLKLVLYYDDVELCNPIGTRRIRHKVGLFYYSIMNLAPQYRSKMESINLYAAALYSHIKEHGLDVILKPFQQDLESLADGVTIENDTMVTGALLAFVADTPASHLGGGFKEGVGFAFQKCRHCNADEVTMQESFSESNFNPRSLKSHEEQCRLIETAPNTELRSHYSTVFGVNRRSIMCDFPFFDVTHMLPQDLMHVFLEGILPFELKLFIKYCVQEQLTTIDQLNAGITSFPYGYYQTRNIPKPISENVINDNASPLIDDAIKMWTLCRIVPFIVKDLVPSENAHWQNLHQILQIAHICMSCVISLETVSVLKELISEHLARFKLLYNRQITPKQHYLIHMPMLIVMYGPPIRLWCTRFEAKHRFFKKIARLGNFKNIAKSLCERHQSLHATNFLDDQLDGSSCPLFTKLEIGKSTALQNNEYRMAVNTLYLQGVMHRDQNPVRSISTAKWVVVFGIKFVATVSVVLLGFDKERELPSFAKVSQILVVNYNKIILHCDCLQTIFYHENLLSYEIAIPDVEKEMSLLIDSDCLPLHEVAHILQFGAKKYVNFRNNISELLSQA